MSYFKFILLEEISNTGLSLFYWKKSAIQVFENLFLVFEKFVKSLWILKWKTCTNPALSLVSVQPLDLKGLGRTWETLLKAIASASPVLHHRQHFWHVNKPGPPFDILHPALSQPALVPCARWYVFDGLLWWVNGQTMPVSSSLHLQGVVLTQGAIWPIDIVKRSLQHLLIYVLSQSGPSLSEDITLRFLECYLVYSRTCWKPAALKMEAQPLKIWHGWCEIENILGKLERRICVLGIYLIYIISIYPSIYIYVSQYLSVCVCLSTYLDLSVCCLSVCPSIHPSIHNNNNNNE